MVDQAMLARVETALKSTRLKNRRLLNVRKRIDTMRAVAREAREAAEHARRQGKRPRRMAHRFLPIIGPSGSGKSTSIEDYVHRFASDLDERGRRTVVHVTLNANATTKRLGSDILEEFEDPEFEEGSAAHLLRRARIFLENAQTEVLVLDELQHLINTDTGRRTAWSVTETIKRMLIMGACPMILMGTPKARSVLLTNSQMKSRCLKPVFLEGLDYSLPEEKTDFDRHCAGLDAALVKHGIFAEQSCLVEGDMPLCLHEVSGGVIGTVCNVVLLAGQYALEKEASRIERDHVSHVIRRWAIPLGYVDRDPVTEGPRCIKPVTFDKWQED